MCYYLQIIDHITFVGDVLSSEYRNVEVKLILELATIKIVRLNSYYKSATWRCRNILILNELVSTLRCLCLTALCITLRLSLVGPTSVQIRTML